jgi:hypothetical protein
MADLTPELLVEVTGSCHLTSTEACFSLSPIMVSLAPFLGVGLKSILTQSSMGQGQLKASSHGVPAPEATLCPSVSKLTKAGPLL